jgi:hypothetical protein
MFEEEGIMAIGQKNSITGDSNWTIRKSEKYTKGYLRYIVYLSLLDREVTHNSRVNKQANCVY